MWGPCNINIVFRLYVVNCSDMWDLKAFPGKFLTIRPTEILRLNVRMISAVYHNNLMAIFLSDH